MQPLMITSPAHPRGLAQQMVRWPFAQHAVVGPGERRDEILLLSDI